MCLVLSEPGSLLTDVFVVYFIVSVQIVCTIESQ